VSVFYPNAQISQLNVQKIDRTLIDPFESGATYARTTWAAKMFKRRFQLIHGPMTQKELRSLLSFYHERGTYDSFWFRDNINRDGNALVRFSQPLPANYQAGIRSVPIVLDEVAPILALPSIENVATAAGATPLVWYDANRELYFEHNGSVIMGERAMYDATMTYPAPYASSAFGLNLVSPVTQYQNYATATLGPWSRTPITGLAALPYTLFCFKAGNTSANAQMWFGFGSAVGDGFGLHSNGTATYVAPLGGSTITGLTTTSSPTAWASWGIVATTTDVSFYLNGTLVATHSQANTFTAGKAAMFVNLDNTQNAIAGSLADMMIIPAVLSAAQLKAMHNLLGYRYGIATV
jgi:hypothetical protein